MSNTQELENFVKETALGIQRRLDATAFIKDVREAAKQKGYDGRMIHKMAKIYVEQNYSDVKRDTTELLDTYESLSL